MEFHGETLAFRKANLHTHTILSDGQFTPDEVIRLYQAQGYHILALTDHRKTNAVSQLDGRGMTLLPGIELHPMGPRGIVWHLLGLGVPEDFAAPAEDLGGQPSVDAVNAAGGACFVAHPYWCAFTASEVMSLSGTLGIEVYNTSTRYIGKAYNMQLWDEMLDAGGRRADAIAVDDVHNESHLFMGWTMIGARGDTAADVMDALRAGRYYATQGPEFTRLSFENGVFEAEFTPCVKAVVLTNRSAGLGLLDGRYRSLRLDTSHLPPGCTYLRCQIQDAAGRFAWSNPVYL